MPARLLILDLLDPRGHSGLAAAVRAANTFEVEAIPIATGILTREGAGGKVAPLRGRLLGAALNEVFQDPVDGMLIGTLPDYWQARAVVKTLTNWLPDTLVYAPLTGAGTPLPAMGTYNRRMQLRGILPEATSVVLPRTRAGDLLEGGPDDPAEVGMALLDAGAHSAWIRDDEPELRTVDLVAHGGQHYTLDYPAPGDDTEPFGAPAALAALLARGRPLRDAIDRAHRYTAGIGSEVLLPAR